MYDHISFSGFNARALRIFLPLEKPTFTSNFSLLSSSSDFAPYSSLPLFHQHHPSLHPSLSKPPNPLGVVGFWVGSPKGPPPNFHGGKVLSFSLLSYCATLPPPLSTPFRHCPWCPIRRLYSDDLSIPPPPRATTEARQRPLLGQPLNWAPLPVADPAAGDRRSRLVAISTSLTLPRPFSTEAEPNAAHPSKISSPHHCLPSFSIFLQATASADLVDVVEMSCSPSQCQWYPIPPPPAG